jgi:hypothetical protein
MADTIPFDIYNKTGDVFAKRRMLFTLKTTKTIPTDDDKSVGIVTRYFAKYTAKRIGEIYEISEQDYTLIEDNALFRKTKIDWIIKGRLHDSVLTLVDGTSILIKGVISQNQELSAIANDEVPGLIQHLQDHMEYWIGE